jgi:hypothetical protein
LCADAGVWLSAVAMTAAAVMAKSRHRAGDANV